MRSTNGRSRGFVLFLSILGVFAPVLPVAAQQQPAPPQRREHIVKGGDTLWDLARIYLNNPFLWPLIYEANKQIVENPHRIFPAERLIIPPLPGETRPAQPTAVVSQPPAAPAGRTRFYVPSDTGRYATLVLAEHARPRRVEPREYYATPWIADTTNLRFVGQVFRSADPRVEDDVLPQTFHPFSTVYLSYMPNQTPRVGDMLLVVSIGRRELPFGRVIEPTGVIRVDSLKDEVMVGLVTHQFGELQTGDLLLPMDSFPDIERELVPVENGPVGTIIDFFLQQPLYSVTDQVFVTLGRESVQVGDEIAAYLPQRQPEKGREDILPERPIARMVITRIGSRGSTARITHLDEAALAPGQHVRVIRRMQ